MCFHPLSGCIQACLLHCTSKPVILLARCIIPRDTFKYALFLLPGGKTDNVLHNTTDF